MKTGEVELHTRRVVWRYGRSDENWRHFGYATVSFGDKPAGVYLDIVINQAADPFHFIDPEAAEKSRTTGMWMILQQETLLLKSR